MFRLRSYFSIPAAGVSFFVSAWIMMMFADMVGDDLGVERFGYTTAMIATIGVWLVIAPVVAAIASKRD